LKPEFVIQADFQLPVETIRAQRMAELANIAAYRALKLQAYKDWSNTEKREKLQELYKRELYSAKEIYKAMPPLTAKLDLRAPIKITPIVKAPTKPAKVGFFQRLAKLFT